MDRHVCVPATTQADHDRTLRLLWQRPSSIATWWPRWLDYANAVPYPVLLERLVWGTTNQATDDDCRTTERAEDDVGYRLPAVRLRRLLTRHLPRILLAQDDHREQLHERFRPFVALLSDGQPGVDPLTAVYHWLLEAMLVPYEITVQHVYATATTDGWTLFIAYLANELGTLDGLPSDMVEAVWKADRARHVLLHAAVRRTVAADLIRQWLLPPLRLSADDIAEDVEYMATLWADTHLDLLTTAVRYRRYSDDFFLAQPRNAVLTAVYPSAQRVCCVDELPDLTPLLMTADLSFDPGRNKKQHTQRRAATHIFLCKQMNQICHLRHLPDTIAKNVERFPELGAMLQLVVRAVLLGNLPRAGGRPSLAARIRITQALARDPFASGPPPVEELLAFTARMRHIVLFLMHEYFVSTCEADVAYDRLFSTHVKWVHYKAVIRYAVQTIRDELQRQTSCNFEAPIDWTSLEDTAKKQGLINVAHTIALTTCKKIHKGRAEELIAKKMISVETAILAHHVARAVAAAPRLAALRLRAQAMDAADDGSDVSFAALIREAQQAGEAALAAFLVEYEKTRTTLAVQALRDQRRVAQAQEMAMAAPSSSTTAAAASKRPRVRARVEHLLERISGRVDAFDEYVARELVLPPIAAQLADMAQPLHRVAAAAAAVGRQPSATIVEREVVDVRGLAELGLTRPQCAEVERWVYEYFAYDPPDNKYKKETLRFGTTSLAAHLVVKHFFRLVTHYRQEQIFARPIDEGLRIMHRLRERLGLMPFEPSPPQLGISLYCPTCQRFMTPPRPSPIWIVCQNDRVLIAQQLAVVQAALDRRLKKAGVLPRPVLLQELVVPPVAVGESGHLIDLRTFKAYCKRSRPPKQRLAEQKRAAKAELEEIRDRLIEAPMLGVNVDQLPRLLGAEALVNTTEAETHVIHLHDVKALVARTLRQRTAVATNRTLRRRTDLLLDTVTAPISTWSSRDHATEPLISVDLVGLWYLRRDQIYGHCVVCGVLTTVEEEKITNHGLSCMNHPHPEFPEDHPHTIAFSAAILDKRRSPGCTSLVARHPHILDEAVSCCNCNTYKTTTTVRVYDGNYRYYDLALCKLCLGAARRQLPSLQVGKTNASAVEPILVTDLLRDLKY